jgi:hypothetical protein
VGPCPNSKKDLKKPIMPIYDPRRQSSGTHTKLVTRRQPLKKIFRQAFKRIKKILQRMKKNQRNTYIEIRNSAFPRWNISELIGWIQTEKGNNNQVHVEN